MRVVRVGAAGTAAELAGLFRGVPVVLSSKTQGLVRDVACQPMIVIATPGFEPRVRPISAEQGTSGHEYRAVAVLALWTSCMRWAWMLGWITLTRGCVRCRCVRRVPVAARR